ncbi:arginine/serine-rich coiled-coil protein 2 [Heracleum sosnowskyi]|uniref:Arginine/serine-rich coiled-coil protein 2 n=1 Tax=Heracleum sosnowskyi TaxID=360622 RepID=A0AAD8JE40_9APIA|nr:arginine/serine-rich coiled-coil protein 2 [Heracleum sosnowskyi]
MDLQTENRIAAILMKEAAELRRQAEQDGVHAYLRQPNVRVRPNSRFITATVLGVQQANRAVEVNEMWSIRQKEQELDDMLKKRQRDRSMSNRSYREQEVDDRQKRKWSDESSSDRSYRDTDMDDRLKKGRSDESSSDRSYKDKRHADTERSSKRSNQQDSLVEEGLKDDEIENFLNSRVKRGRGAVGSRMDETGPYLPPRQDSNVEDLPFMGGVFRKERDRNAILGPEKPSHLVSWSSSEEESDDEKHYKAKKVKKASSSKRSKKHKSKEKSKDSKKKRRKEERRHKKHKKSS